jgi:predicted ATPase/DNA-binding CsgD family transcriptional regulator
MNNPDARIIFPSWDGALAANTIAQLPVPLTSFIGREKELTRVSTFLQGERVRLLTLTGPGGVGKTRMGLAVATQLSAHFPDGIFVIALASLRDPALLLPTICSTLEPEDRSSLFSLEYLIARLLHKSSLLLLDNFEHLLSAAPLLVELLQACPTLKILVTSRAVLHIEGEQVFEVLPLDTRTGTLKQVSSSPAIQLFVQRAQARNPDFALDQANTATIAAICRRLDGLPLSIELAAVWIRLFPLHLLLAQLETNLFWLKAERVDASERQQSLSNTLRWSYHLLNDAEQRLFCLFSLFVGGASLEAIVSVASSLWNDTPPLLEMLLSLVDKSLLLVSKAIDDTPRFSMLETIREYGWICLQAREDTELFQQKHAEYFLMLAEEAEPKLTGPQQRVWFQRLRQEYANIHEALRWSMQARQVLALRFISALLPFWAMDSLMRNEHHWFETLAEGVNDISPTIQAKALYASASLAYYQGNHNKARALGKQSLQCFRALGDESNVVLTLHGLAHIAALAQNRPADVLPIIKETLPLTRKMGDHWRLAEALFLSAVSHCLLHKYAQAQAAVEESLALCQTFEDQHALIVYIIHIAGYIAYNQNRLKAAHSYYHKCFMRSQYSPEPLLMTTSLVGLGEVAAKQGQMDWAAQLWGMEAALREKLPPRRGYLARRPDEEVVAKMRAYLGNELFSAAWAQGRTMSVEHVISVLDQTEATEQSQHLFRQGSHATSSSQPTKAPASDSTPLHLVPHDDLSAREVEVLRLLAQGLTNAQIAERLVISPRTVNTHLTSIYRKINVTTRSAATRYAIDHHLV